MSRGMFDADLCRLFNEDLSAGNADKERAQECLTTLTMNLFDEFTSDLQAGVRDKKKDALNMPFFQAPTSTTNSPSLGYRM